MSVIPATYPRPAIIDPADLALPPTQSIDLTDIVTAQLARGW